MYPFGVPPLGGSSFKPLRKKGRPRRSRREGGTPNLLAQSSVGQAVPSCLVSPAHGDHGEIGIGQKIFPDRALALEQFEPRGALLAFTDRNRIEHRIDADHLVDILLELVDTLDREA